MLEYKCEATGKLAYIGQENATCVHGSDVCMRQFMYFFKEGLQDRLKEVGTEQVLQLLRAAIGMTL